MSSLLLAIEPWSDHLIAAGVVLALLVTQLLQFKLKTAAPAPLPVEPHRNAVTEIDMPENLRRFFGAGTATAPRVIA